MYMRAHVLLNILNELVKMINARLADHLRVL